MARSGASVIDKDYGLKNLVSRTHELNKKPYTKVGVQVGSQHREPTGQSTDLVTIAAANEFGVPGHIPPRSFIRTAVDLNRRNLDQASAGFLRDYLIHHLQLERALGLLGAMVQGMIQRRITSNITPENAVSTAERKQRPREETLRDTGQLLKSIRYVVVSKGGT